MLTLTQTTLRAPSTLALALVLALAGVLALAASCGDDRSGNDTAAEPSANPSAELESTEGVSSGPSDDGTGTDETSSSIDEPTSAATDDNDVSGSGNHGSQAGGGGGGAGLCDPNREVFTLTLGEWGGAMDLVVLGTVTNAVSVEDRGVHRSGGEERLLPSEECSRVYGAIAFDLEATSVLHGEAPERIAVQAGAGNVFHIVSDVSLPEEGSRVILGLWDVADHPFMDMGNALMFPALWLAESASGQWASRFTIEDHPMFSCSEFEYSVPDLSGLDVAGVADLVTDAIADYLAETGAADNPLRAAADRDGALTRPDERTASTYRRWFGVCVQSGSDSGDPAPPDCASWDNACFGENAPESCDAMPPQCVCDHTPDCTLAIGDGWTCVDGRCSAP